MEFNVDRQIKSYWDKFIGLTDTNNEEFADATSEHSVRASKFLNGLDIDPIMPEVNYRRLKAGGIPLHRIPIEKT